MEDTFKKKWVSESDALQVCDCLNLPEGLFETEEYVG